MNNLFDFPWKIFSPYPSSGKNLNAPHDRNNDDSKEDDNLNDDNNEEGNNSHIGYSQDDEILPRRLHQDEEDKTAENDGGADSNDDSEEEERGLETQPMGITGGYNYESGHKEKPAECNKENVQLHSIISTEYDNPMGIGGTSDHNPLEVQNIQKYAPMSPEKVNIDNGRRESMQQTEPARPSRLTQFFANVADEQNFSLNPDKILNSVSSVRDWKNSRKTFLLRYFTRRFIGDEVDDDDDCSDSGSERDVSSQGPNDCDAFSFSSEVFDKAFQSGYDQMPLCTSYCHSRTVHAPESKADSDGEDDQDDDKLHTQPEFSSQRPLNATIDLLNSSKSHDSKDIGGVLDEEESHLTYLNTQASPFLKQASQSEYEMLGGKKRKAEMISVEDERKSMSQSNPNLFLSESIVGDRKEAVSTIDGFNDTGDRSIQRSPQKKHGLMWNGKFDTVPLAEDTNTTCSKLDELDLSTKVINLGLCRVLRIWEIRNTKRMDNMPGHRSQEFDDKCSHIHEDSHLNTQISSSLEPFEEDGPLNIAYKKVFSMEIVQLDNGIAQEWSTASDVSVSNITAAAFCDGRYHLYKERSRKRRHAIRKIRVFFYDDYADAIHSVVRKQRTKSDKKKFVPFLISFARVDAKCILPFSISPDRFNPHLQQYIMNPFGDDEYGILSPYCICLGGMSSMKLGDEKMRFDCTGLEIRLARSPENIFPSGVCMEESKSSEVVVNSSTVTNLGRVHVVVDEASVLARQYVNLLKRSNAVGRETPSLEEGSDFNGECNDERDRLECEKKEVSGTVVITANPQDSPNNDDLSPDAVRRPKSIVPLATLLPLLCQNNMKTLKQSINVYGVVLGFTHPELTRNDWKMTITIIDETTRLPDQAQASPTTGNTLSNDKSLDRHVPCTTIIIFAKDRSKFPIIRSAGDVVCCRNVTLQQYNTIPQLRSRNPSNIIVLGPEKIRCPGEELQNSTNPNDWFVSCTSQVSYLGTPAAIDWPLANSLWRWGQRRLSQHPTISRTCRISIGSVGEFEQTISDRDLTAIVTDIISVPLHLRRSDLNRGYIRIWDGTGPSYADPVDP